MVLAPNMISQTNSICSVSEPDNFFQEYQYIHKSAFLIIFQILGVSL